jgi:hypothetical protein
MEYADEGVPLCVLAGREYGSGSSRDSAAKGPRLLGVSFVIAVLPPLTSRLLHDTGRRVGSYAAIRSSTVLRCESTRWTVPRSSPPRSSLSLKLPMRRAVAASGRRTSPSAKLPMRLAEAVRGERASPSL